MTKESGVAVIVNLSDRCGRVYNNDFEESHEKPYQSNAFNMLATHRIWSKLDSVNPARKL